MTEEAIQGTCEDCGKVYKVPSADRTYRCKACGGTVSVYDEEEEDFDDEDEWEEDEYEEDDEEEEEEEEPRYRRGRRGRRGRDDDDDDDEDEDEDDGRRRASDRLRHSHGARDSSKMVWIAMAVVLALGAAAFFLHAFNVAPWSDKGEKDLNVVNAGLAADWGSGDLGAIRSYYHPNARSLFDRKLEKMVDQWGWEDDFPAITEHSAEITAAMSKPIPTGESTLKFGEGGEVTALWQFEKGPNKWYIYDLRTSSPPIEKRAEQLKTLWANSNPDSLRPLFFSESATSMIAKVRDRVAKEGWKGNFPELGEYTTTEGDEGRTRVTFKTPEGDLTAKFGFSQDDYAWYLSGFVWP